LIPHGIRDGVDQIFWRAVKAEVVVAVLDGMHHLVKPLQLLLAV